MSHWRYDSPHNVFRKLLEPVIANICFCYFGGEKRPEDWVLDTREGGTHYFPDMKAVKNMYFIAEERRHSHNASVSGAYSTATYGTTRSQISTTGNKWNNGSKTVLHILCLRSSRSTFTFFCSTPVVAEHVQMIVSENNDDFIGVDPSKPSQSSGSIFNRQVSSSSKRLGGSESRSRLLFSPNSNTRTSSTDSEL